MVGKIQTGFEPESVTIKVKDILPLKKIPASVRKGRKYRQITAAIREIGIVQPPDRHAPSQVAGQVPAP